MEQQVILTVGTGICFITDKILKLTSHYKISNLYQYRKYGKASKNLILMFFCSLPPNLALASIEMDIFQEAF